MYVACRHLTDSHDFSLNKGSEIELILPIGSYLYIYPDWYQIKAHAETELMLPIGDIVLSLDLSRLEPNKAPETELILDVSM